MIDQLKSWARTIKRDIAVLWLAARHPAVPWLAKTVAAATVAYALSPIDLIPDFVPVLGYLDDLIITPGGIWLAVRLIPPEVMAEARATAATRGVDARLGKVGALIIISVWILAAIGVLYYVLSTR